MSKHTITIDVDTDQLRHLEDVTLIAFWHAAQINPAPFGDRDACHLAEAIGREIVRRFISATTPPLWNHQGAHINAPGTATPARAQALGRSWPGKTAGESA